MRIISHLQYKSNHIIAGVKSTGRIRSARFENYALFCLCSFHVLLDDLQNFLGSIHRTGDQLLGADCSAQAAGCTDRVVDSSQVVFHLDRIVRTDLHAQTAANAALAASTNRNCTFCMGSAGNDHMFIIIYGDDQPRDVRS